MLTLADLPGVVELEDSLTGWKEGLRSYALHGLDGRNPYNFAGGCFSLYQGWECCLAACAATMGHPVSERARSAGRAN